MPRLSHQHHMCRIGDYLTIDHDTDTLGRSNKVHHVAWMLGEPGRFTGSNSVCHLEPFCQINVAYKFRAAANAMQ